MQARSSTSCVLFSVLFADFSYFNFFQENSSHGAPCLGMTPMTEANTSSNEDLLFGKPESQTKKDKNVSPPKKSEDRLSGIPRPARDKSARRQLVLDIAGINNKAKSAAPSLYSPTLLSPDPTKRRTQSR